MPPLIVLADANVLVKDVVSFAFFDLARAGAIDLRWTPQIEVEYAKHRARLRAGAGGRGVLDRLARQGDRRAAAVEVANPRMPGAGFPSVHRQ